MAGEQVRRMPSFVFEIPVDEHHMWQGAEFVEVLKAKLLAEQERLIRLLPEAPAGHHWEFDHQQSENMVTNVVKYRVLAQLKENV